MPIAAHVDEKQIIRSNWSTISYIYHFYYALQIFGDHYAGHTSEESLICVKFIIWFHFNPHSTSIEYNIYNIIIYNIIDTYKYIYIYICVILFSVQKETLSFLHSPVALKAPTLMQIWRIVSTEKNSFA